MRARTVYGRPSRSGERPAVPERAITDTPFSRLRVRSWLPPNGRSALGTCDGSIRRMAWVRCSTQEGQCAPASSPLEADSTRSPVASPEPDRKSGECDCCQNIERRLADQVAKVTECVAVSASQLAEVVVSVGHGTGGVTGNLGVAWGSWVGAPLAAGDWPGGSMSST